MISKVKNVQGSGSFENQYGALQGDGKKLLFKFEYEFEDGTILTANHKTPTPRFKAGDEVDYTVTKDDPQYGKSGKVEAPQEQPDPNPPETFHPNKPNYGYKETEEDYHKRQKFIVLQSSLKEAVQFHASNGFSDSGMDTLKAKQEVYETAEFFAFKILNSDLLK